jgi:hypothetical protein
MAAMEIGRHRRVGLPDNAPARIRRIVDAVIEAARSG